MHPDAFTDMLRAPKGTEGALPFDETKACRLMQIASNTLIRDNLEAMPRAYTVLHMVSRLDEKTFTARLNDGTINPDMKGTDLDAAEDEDRDDDKPERTGRGKQGKGTNSKADPQPPLPREVELAGRILATAYELYECSNEAVKLIVSGAVDRAIEAGLAKSLKSDRDAVLAGLRYAVELADLLGPYINPPADAA